MILREKIVKLAVHFSRYGTNPAVLRDFCVKLCDFNDVIPCNGLALRRSMG